MTSYFYRDFGPERLSIKHTSFIFSRGLKLSPCREDGRVESYWLSALNFLVRIAIQPEFCRKVLQAYCDHMNDAILLLESADCKKKCGI